LTIALAGTTARLGVKNIFWLVMALGWTVFFIGGRLTSRARRPATPAKQEGQQNNVGALHSTTWTLTRKRTTLAHRDVVPGSSSFLSFIRVELLIQLQFTQLDADRHLLV